MTKIQAKQTALATGSGTLLTDVLSVTDANNTISKLQGNPTGRVFLLFINGVAYSNSVKNPPFTINGQNLVWSAANSGFALEMADSVFAIYTSTTGGNTTSPTVVTTGASS